MQKEAHFHLMYVGKITGFESVNCIGGGTKDKETPGINIDWDYWNGYQCQTGNVTKYELGRPIFTSRVTTNWAITYIGTRLQPGDSGIMVTQNGGATAGMVY